MQIVVTLTSQNNWIVQQLDIRSTFLNNELKKEVFMVQPRRFKVQEKEHQVCRLRKALYGLQKALRTWYSNIDSFFQRHGFEKQL
jgi:hypothetical protein